MARPFWLLSEHDKGTRYSSYCLCKGGVVFVPTHSSRAKPVSETSVRDPPAQLGPSGGVVVSHAAATADMSHGIAAMTSVEFWAHLANHDREMPLRFTKHVLNYRKSCPALVRVTLCLTWRLCGGGAFLRLRGSHSCSRPPPAPPCPTGAQPQRQLRARARGGRACVGVCVCVGGRNHFTCEMEALDPTMPSTKERLSTQGAPALCQGQVFDDGGILVSSEATACTCK